MNIFAQHVVVEPSTNDIANNRFNAVKVDKQWSKKVIHG